MSQFQDSEAEGPDIPEMIEQGPNPGWSIRVGVSRSEIAALEAAEKQGTWFASEEEMDTFVQSRIRNERLIDDDN